MNVVEGCVIVVRNTLVYVAVMNCPEDEFVLVVELEALREDIEVRDPGIGPNEDVTEDSTELPPPLSPLVVQVDL